MKHFKILLLILTTLYLFLPAILSAQMTWTCATDSAEWSARSVHTTVIHDNKIWVMGGLGGSPLWKNDVWYSPNGVSWTQAIDSAGWQRRSGHASVVFDNKMWVIGGGYGLHPYYNYMNDVWYSTDGVNWIQATASANWQERDGHTPVVFNNRMWVIGGCTDSGYKNDIWYSTDGINWTEATSSAAWSARLGHTSVVFDNKMWVMGGFIGSGCKNDVWYSTDGVNWIQATANAGWSERQSHTSVVFDNKMWVMGGWNHSNNLLNDVWYSSDGAGWIQATDSSGWSARCWHTSAVFNNTMWVIGGSDSVRKNDVWYSTGLGVEDHSTPYAQRITQNATIVCGLLNLQSSISNLQCEITLLDLTGRKVANLKSGTNDIRYLAPGVYFVRSNNNNKVTKIIITK